MSPEQALDWFSQRPAVRSVRAAVCDLNGSLRGKRLPVEQVHKVLAGELRMPLSCGSLDIWGEDLVHSPLLFDSGDADGLCHWTGRAPLAIDWLDQPSALLPLWFGQADGGGFAGDPRRALAAVVDRWAARGCTPVVATELEFYLMDPSGKRPRAPRSPATGKRLTSDGILSMDEVDQFEAFIADVYRACAAQGIPADAAIAEGGAGQFEINLRHVADPLQAADDAVFFKRIVKGVARRHGFAASFMAKPYAERAGNGFHVHMSLQDHDGANVFDDGSEHGSDTLRYAIAGLLAAMQECTLVFAPHLNSYRRLQPGTHAPAAVAWGHDNRSVAVRVPGGPAAARRLEHRVAGADANPYLVLTAILGAALEGVEQAVMPPPPIDGNAYDRTLPHLPADWRDATILFEQGSSVARVFDPMLSRLLVLCKQQEQRVFAAQVTNFEYHSYLDSV